MFKKNTIFLLLELATTMHVQIFGYFYTYAGASYQSPCDCCSACMYCVPPYQAPICTAGQCYQPQEYLVNEIDRSLADLAYYSIPDFCALIPYSYQQAAWYGLQDMRALCNQISRNWSGFMHTYNSYNCYMTPPTCLLNAILNNIQRIKIVCPRTPTAARSTFGISCCECMFQDIIEKINQELRSINYLTDSYTGTRYDRGTVETIVICFDRIAQHFESFAYYY